MGLIGVLLVGRAVADVAADDDHRGLVFGAEEFFVGFEQGFGIVGIGAADDIPAEAFEAGGDIVGVGEFGVAFDRNVVVVVDPAEFIELKVAGDRGGFVRDAFHQVAVTAEREDVEIEDIVVGLVEVRDEPARGDGHADAVAAALAERAGGGFDAGGFDGLGMAGTTAAELAEQFDLIQRDGKFAGRFAMLIELFDAGQMQQRIEQHRGVAAGEDEAIAVGPLGIFRIEPEDVLPEGVSDGGEGHRRAGMAAIGFLDRVHRQGADGIDGEEGDVVGGRGGRGRGGFGGCGHGRTRGQGSVVRDQQAVARPNWRCAICNWTMLAVLPDFLGAEPLSLGGTKGRVNWRLLPY